jgi:hypothetical protein
MTPAGEFRAGMMAAFIGAQAAVTLGGGATMAVAGIWNWALPGAAPATADQPEVVAN